MNTNLAILSDSVTFINTHSTTFITAAVVLVVVVVAVSTGVSYLLREAEKARHRKQYKQWRKVVKADGGLPEFDSPVTLESGEVCYYSASGVRLCEPRAVRSGSYGGLSSRGVGGFRIHSGGFRSESHDGWRRQDTGSLCVTSRRIVFVGGMQTRVIELADILASQAATAQIQFSTSQRQKAVLFANVNGQIIRDVLAALCS